MPPKDSPGSCGSRNCSQPQDHAWFADCAAAGDPVCQYLYSTKDVPGESSAQQSARIVQLTQAAAEAGIGEACVKLARAHLHFLPPPLPYNETVAQRYYEQAAGHSDAHSGLAQLQLMQLEKLSVSGSRTTDISIPDNVTQSTLHDVVMHLELAALSGHAYAMFNLGIAHAFGYCPGNAPNNSLSQQWMMASGLPEGRYIAALQQRQMEQHTHHIDKRESLSMMERARKLGLGQPWRRQAREQTGSGGAGGVDLNLPWPLSRFGSKPPRV